MKCNIKVEFYIIRENTNSFFFSPVTKVFDPIRLWQRDPYLPSCVIDIPLYPRNMYTRLKS
jgi:hypothetical protein